MTGGIKSEVKKSGCFFKRARSVSEKLMSE